MSFDVRSDWLIGNRLRRLATLLDTIPANLPGLLPDHAVRECWRQCDGPLEEIQVLIDLLMELGLVELRRGQYLRSTSGSRVARLTRIGDFRPLGSTLIKAGWFHDQARVLVETGEMVDRSLLCPTTMAQRIAPQLVGVLQWWPEVELRPQLSIPEDLLSEVGAIWALMPPSASVEQVETARQAVGTRGEMYSVHMERTRLGGSGIFWVAQDDDTLGYDVEDRSVNPRRRIEVKGSRMNEVNLILTDNEWKKAQEFGSAYEIQFWGGIDLDRDPAIEYEALRAAGYPLIIQDPAVALTGTDWNMEPLRWRVTRAGSE